MRRIAESAGAARALEPEQPLRDAREVAFYEDALVEAGTITGSLAENPPAWVQIPADWKLPVHFVIRVHGDSMTGIIEDGQYAAFEKAERGINGKVVVALVDGGAVIKMYNVVGKKAFLVSMGDGYEPIPVTKRVQIQGIFKCPFPSPKAAGLRIRHVENSSHDASHA